jgi:predicted nucleic acid-binding Zn ribbon protein
MKNIQEILKTLLAEMPAAQQAKINGFQALVNWPEIVGETLAAVTEPLKVENEILLIRVKEAVWRSELQFMKPELLEKIRGNTGIKLRDLKFV